MGQSERYVHLSVSYVFFVTFDFYSLLSSVNTLLFLGVDLVTWLKTVHLGDLNWCKISSPKMYLYILCNMVTFRNQLMSNL